ncbi:hypothetical protein D3C84_1307160 [compost metagenome]
MDVEGDPLRIGFEWDDSAFVKQMLHAVQRVRAFAFHRVGMKGWMSNLRAER